MDNVRVRSGNWPDGVGEVVSGIRGKWVTRPRKERFTDLVTFSKKRDRGSKDTNAA